MTRMKQKPRQIFARAKMEWNVACVAEFGLTVKTGFCVRVSYIRIYRFEQGSLYGWQRTCDERVLLYVLYYLSFLFTHSSFHYSIFARKKIYNTLAVTESKQCDNHINVLTELNTTDLLTHCVLHTRRSYINEANICPWDVIVIA